MRTRVMGAVYIVVYAATLAALMLAAQRPQVSLAGPSLQVQPTATAGTAPATGGSVEAARAHAQALADLGKALRERLPPRGRERLGGVGQILSRLGEPPGVAEAAEARLRRGQTSDPLAADDFLSRFTGMTQTQPALAWCGDRAVAAFVDTGSFLSTLGRRPNEGPSPSGSVSFVGWSVSEDSGRTFTDRGPVVPDPLPIDPGPQGIVFRHLLGDPAVACSSSRTFYLATPTFDQTRDNGFRVGIGVSRSTDGGQSWTGAVAAAGSGTTVGAIGPIGAFTAPSISLTPGPTPDRDIVHVVYTRLQSPDQETGCAGAASRIEHVRSVDGGSTWSPPQILEAGCAGDLGGVFVGDVHVQAGVAGDLFVAWEHYVDEVDFATWLIQSTRSIKVSRSANAGQPPTGSAAAGPSSGPPVTFGQPIVVSSVVPIGDGGTVQGGIGIPGDFTGLAVDRSTGPRRGAVYVTWHDGRRVQRPDPFAAFAVLPEIPGFHPALVSSCTGAPVHVYCFGDVLLSRSVDAGATWSPPIRVIDDPATAPVDQFFPSVAVDGTGHVYVAFYDRSRDPRNFLVDTVLARSPDGGTTWTSLRLTTDSFVPITGVQDQRLGRAFFGTHLGIATDATDQQPGALVAWGDTSRGDANVVTGQHR